MDHPSETPSLCRDVDGCASSVENQESRDAALRTYGETATYNYTTHVSAQQYHTEQSLYHEKPVFNGNFKLMAKPISGGLTFLSHCHKIFRLGFTVRVKTKTMATSVR